MPNDSDLLDAVHALPEEGQRAVLSYALFLRQEAEPNRLREDEAAWDQSFSDPQKMARFAEWAKNSLLANPPELFDRSRL